MNKKKHSFLQAAVLLFALAMAVFPLSSHPVKAYADNVTTGMETKSFDVKATVNKANTTHVQETITVDFTSPHHGITISMSAAAITTTPIPTAII